MHADIDLDINDRMGYRQVKDGLQETYILRLGDVVCKGTRYVNHEIAAGAVVSAVWANRPFKEMTMQDPENYWSCWTKQKIDRPKRKIFVPKSTFHSTPLPLP